MQALLRPNRWLLLLPAQRMRQFEPPKNCFRPRRPRDDSRYSFAKPVFAAMGLADPLRSPRFVVGSFAARARQSHGTNGVVFGSDYYCGRSPDASMPLPKPIRSFGSLAPGISPFPDLLSVSCPFRC